MSFASLNTASRDEALIARVAACVQQEARQNPNVDDSAFAAAVRSGGTGVAGALIWPVVLNTEEAYESALLNEVSDPGADPSVITDEMILAAVQASWPDAWPLGAQP